MGKEKIFIKRYYDVEVDGFTLVTTIRIWDMFDVDQGGYYKLEEELVDEFDMSIADIKKDYAGIRCDMFRDIEEEYNITERRYAVKEGGVGGINHLLTFYQEKGNTMNKELTTQEQVALAKEILQVKNRRERSKKLGEILDREKLSADDMYSLYNTLLTAIKVYGDVIGFDDKDFQEMALTILVLEKVEEAKETRVA